ncbi:MAG TPA: hypothetical protein VGR71_10125 [Nitrospira sp.]|nr:hypothetical protein [Nitrospira sp.]
MASRTVRLTLWYPVVRGLPIGMETSTLPPATAFALHVGAFLISAEPPHVATPLAGFQTAGLRTVALLHEIGRRGTFESEAVLAVP